MERGDLAAVIIGLSLVIILTVVLSPPAYSTRQVSDGVATTRVPTTLTTPVPVTTEPTSPQPTPPAAPTKRITYTSDYYLFPVRFLPSDMSRYGSSDIEWRYNSSVAFAYLEENHGGITEPFTVPSSVWRLTSTLSAVKTPERARFRMILVDQESGRVLEGVEIRFPGSVTKTVTAGRRPVYMVIEATNVDRLIITIEIPPGFVQ